MRKAALFVLLSVLTIEVHAQKSVQYSRPSYLFRVENTYAGNGIGVGEPKVFDNRSLLLMLEQHEASLARLNAIDQTKILSSIGLLQGYEKSDVTRSFSVSTFPTPGIDLTEKKDTNTGALIPDQRITKSSEFTPRAPTLDAANFPTVGDDKIGLAAQDILSEQVNLMYQIVNLRLLLERSITDRYIKSSVAGQKGAPRAQAVLGFQVSLDPLRQHIGKAAIVEVVLKSKKGKKAPSLVSLMPQAKTYNVASISQKSTSFSASAVVKVVTLGYSQRNSGQTYFVHQDSDTIAIVRPRSNANDPLVFGWQFRPVLNLNSVDAGIRHLFAVVALDDEADLESSIEVNIRTYWTSYDKKNAVVSSRPKDEAEITYDDFAIPSSTEIQEGLGPVVKRVEFNNAGEDSALINVWGENFFNGTSVVIGNRVITANDNALIVKSDQLLQIAVKPSEIALTQPYIGGRFGASVKVLDEHKLGNPALLPDKFEMFAEFDVPTASSSSAIEVILETVAKPDRVTDLKGHSVILTVGSNTFVRGPSDWSQRMTSTKTSLPGLRTELKMPPGFLEKNPTISATVPFLGPEYQQVKQLYLPQSVEKAVLVHSGPIEQIWGIVGKGFDDSIKNNPNTAVVADKKYAGKELTFDGATLLTFKIPVKRIAEIKTILVTLGYNTPFLVAPPKMPPSKGVIGQVTLPNPKAGSAPSIVFSGENLSEIGKISFDTNSLPFSVAPDGKKVVVFLSRKVTEKVGDISLVVEFKDGSIQSGNLKIE